MAGSQAVLGGESAANLVYVVLVFRARHAGWSPTLRMTLGSDRDDSRPDGWRHPADGVVDRAWVEEQRPSLRELATWKHALPC